MYLGYALALYIIILVILIICLCKYGIYVWSSIVIAIVICWILLNILIPPNEVNEDNTTSSSYALYFVIQILSFFIVVIYALVCASKDYVSDYVTIKIHSKHLYNNYKNIEIV